MLSAREKSEQTLNHKQWLDIYYSMYDRFLPFSIIFFSSQIYFTIRFQVIIITTHSYAWNCMIKKKNMVHCNIWIYLWCWILYDVEYYGLTLKRTLKMWISLRTFYTNGEARQKKSKAMLSSKIHNLCIRHAFILMVIFYVRRDSINQNVLKMFGRFNLIGTIICQYDSLIERHCEFSISIKFQFTNRNRPNIFIIFWLT